MKSHALHAALWALLSLGASAQTAKLTPTPSDAQRVKAEVQADLEIWHQAGMSFVASPLVVSSSRGTPEYAKYLTMRNGKEFQEAVARHLQAQTGQ
jgi:hypothetical protein